MFQNGHFIVDVVGGHTEGNTVVVNLGEQWKACLTCPDGESDPATCPVGGGEAQAGR